MKGKNSNGTVISQTQKDAQQKERFKQMLSRITHSRNISGGWTGEDLEFFARPGLAPGSGHRWHAVLGANLALLLPSLPPAAIPSAPQAVISSVNETSLVLEWTPPRDSGGREDLVYNIICKSCGSGRGACTRCGDNVQYAPRQLGLTEPRIYISDLLAHTQYTFEIQAVNGVTDQSPFSPQFASVNITTNQAGEQGRCGWGRRRGVLLRQVVLASLERHSCNGAGCSNFIHPNAFPSLEAHVASAPLEWCLEA